MDFYKIAQTIEISLDIPDSKKKIAKAIVKKLDQVNDKLNAFETHLDILYNPFTNHEDVTVESVQEVRGTLSRYKDAIQQNLYEIKKIAIYVVMGLENFSSDIKIKELLTSFTDFIEELEDACENLFKNMDNWSSPDYRKDVLEDMENIKTDKNKIQDLIFDRIIKHINSNILAKSWVSSISDDLEFSIKKKEPYLKQLFKERENALNGL